MTNSNFQLNFQGNINAGDLGEEELPLTKNFDLQDNVNKAGFNVDYNFNGDLGFKPFIDFGDLGEANFSYNIDTNFDIPEEINPGETFTIDTSFDVDSAKINGSSLSPPKAGIDLVTNIKEKSGITNIKTPPGVGGDGQSVTFGPISTSPNLFTIEPGGVSIPLLENDQSDDNGQDDNGQDNQSDDNGQDDNGQDNQSDGNGQDDNNSGNTTELPIGVSIIAGIPNPTIDETKKQDPGQTGELPKIKTSGQSDPFLGLEGSLGELVTLATGGSIPVSVEKSLGPLQVEGTLIDPIVDLGTELKQTFQLNPENIETEIKVDNPNTEGSDQTQVQPLGSNFTFERLFLKKTLNY